MIVFFFIISGRPSISGSLITMATIGEDVTLECEIDAHPTPKLSFSRESSAIDKISNSSKYDVRVLRESRVSSLFEIFSGANDLDV